MIFQINGEKIKGPGAEASCVVELGETGEQEY